MVGGKTKGPREGEFGPRMGRQEGREPVRKTNRRHAEWMLLADAMQCDIKRRD